MSENKYHISASNFLTPLGQKYKCATMAAAPNHMIIFLIQEYLRAEQARCTKNESILNTCINRNMSRIIAGPRSEYNKRYNHVLNMASDLAQWREYRIEIGASRWVLDQI